MKYPEIVVMASLAQDSVLGRTIAGKYLIESSVGSGAMGTLYRARQIALDKTVALKVLRREFEQNEEFVARFGVEARAASKLDHPNSTRVIDFGREPDGLLYIAMEYLEGRDLYEAMREEGPFSAERIANIIAQALAAIAVAHDIGVLHRDLKPENIMLLNGLDDEGRSTDMVKVCDFGIAKMSGSALADPRSSGPISTPGGDNQRLTRMGLIMGTPAYMSPEQACGEEADARADIYAIGIILYELLTGRVPFEAPTPEEVAKMHVSREPTHPLDVNPHANPELAKICLKAIQKSPLQRYATARDMRAEIRAVMQLDLGIAPSGPLPLSAASAPRLSGSILRVADTPTLPQLGRTGETARIPRKRPVLAFSIGAIVLLALGAGAYLRYGSPASRRVAVAPPAETTKVDTPTPVPTSEVHATAATTEPDPKPEVAIVKRQPVAAVAPPAPPPPAHPAHPVWQAPAPPRPGAKAPVHAASPTPDPEPPPPPAPSPAPPPPVAAAPQAAPPPTPRPIDTALPTAPAAPAAPAPAPFDPSRARMGVGAITTERMSSRDANAVLSRGDLLSCYTASVKGGESASPGPVLLTLQVDEMRVTRATASGGGPSLRRCIESRVVGARVPSADTGDANAKIPLNFSSQ